MSKSSLFRNVWSVGVSVSLGLLIVASAQAMSVTTTVNGMVTLADINNPFGLMAGDAVTAVAQYDDAGIPATGAFALDLDSNPAFSLIITLGSFVFEETDDDRFATGFPQLQFLNGDILGINFTRNQFAFGAFSFLGVESSGAFTLENITFHDQFSLNDLANENVLLEGPWDFPNAVTVPTNGNPIPEPGTWLLFGTGIIGLFGYKKLKKRSTDS